MWELLLGRFVYAADRRKERKLGAGPFERYQSESKEIREKYLDQVKETLMNHYETGRLIGQFTGYVLFTLAAIGILFWLIRRK